MTLAEAVAAPSIDDAFLDDPYPAYRAWREAGPVLWSDAFFGGAWLLTRHAVVEAALRDPALSAQRTGGWVMAAAQQGRAELRPFQSLFARAMLFLDAPDHGRLRQILMPAFRPDALAPLQNWLDATVTERVRAFHGRFDFMAELARPLPAHVIGRLMDVDPALETTFMHWCDNIAVFIGATQPEHAQLLRAQRSLLEMTAYFERELLPWRRQHLGDDLVSRLLHAEAQGQIESSLELLAQCAMLLFAGYETTRNLLGNGLHALLSHPSQWRLLCRQPDLAGNAVRELLRFDSPVQWTGRRVTRAMTLCGQAIQRGDLVLPLIGSANRDPARHRNPEALQIDRSSPGALSFGSGAHICIGAALTHMEAQTVLRVLATHKPSLTLDGVPVRNRNPLYRGLAMLPVRAA
ncbi:cytochrome P450 [Tepidicella baoligensis]|uniref:cytochrome P450 n=1 Tax=Tepidicella baoligensis TaxID=2707016 RepID=UPI0015DAC6EE|nr:cytochrome P450 [Tepidicella baoligensis]